MTEAAWTFEVGGISLSLVGPDAWVEPFAQAWTSWTGRDTGWKVHWEQDASLPTPDGCFSRARPRFAGGRCLLEAPGLAGEIAPGEGIAVLRAHPSTDAGDLACFIRATFALVAFDQGALLLHAAGIVHRGGAYAFFGRSGSGKTTAARLSRAKPVLNDDLLVLRPNETGWEAWATPFGRRRVPEIRSAPLRALLCLTQASEERLEQMAGGPALGELVASSPVVNADPVRVSALLSRCEEIMRVVPVCSLHFRKSDAFWEVIDARFE